MCRIRFNHTKKNPLIIPLLIAQTEGLFTKRGLEVDLTLTEDFTFDGNKAFLEGQSDAMIGDLTFFFYLLEQGKKAVITSNLTRTICLVGKKELVAPYKGLNVGVNRKGLFRLYLENDLKTLMSDVNIVWLNNTYERMEALAMGTIDALVAIQPFVNDLTTKGYKILWDSRKSDKYLVMWAFDEAFYEKYTKEVSIFHQCIEEAQQFFNARSPEEKVRLCHNTLGYPLPFAKQMGDFTFEKQQAIPIEDFTLCMEWMKRENEITGSYDPTKLIKPMKIME